MGQLCICTFVPCTVNHTPFWVICYWFIENWLRPIISVILHYRDTGNIFQVFRSHTQHRHSRSINIIHHKISAWFWLSIGFLKANCHYSRAEIDGTNFPNLGRRGARQLGILRTSTNSTVFLCLYSNLYNKSLKTFVNQLQYINIGTYISLDWIMDVVYLGKHAQRCVPVKWVGFTALLAFYIS